MSGLLFVVVFVLAGFDKRAHDVGAIPPPTPTTTTTTESPAASWQSSDEEIQPVPESECHCCAASGCMERLVAVYLPILRDSDFTRLVDNIDDLCERDLPATERCLQTSASAGCYTDLIINLYQRLCDVKSDLKGGQMCWSSGFQEGMQRCLKPFLTPWSTQPGAACRVVSRAKACVWHMMATLPLCSATDATLVIDYVRGNTLPLCPYQ